jgi:hypothetical protein
VARDPSPRPHRAARTAVAAAAALVLGLTASGCGGSGQRMGADPAKVGPQSEGPGAQLPTAGATAVYDPATQDRSTRPPAPARPSAEPDPRFTDLTRRLTAAVSGGGHPAAHLATAFSASGGNQLSITWTVNSDIADTGGPARARRDARALLAIVQRSQLDYGSVVLIVHGVIRDKYGVTEAKVVRAKYSRALVRGTSFSGLALSRVFLICDDKPAEIIKPFG